MGTSTQAGKAGKAGTQAQAPVTCTICGKHLKKGATIKAGAGATCLHNAQLKTPAQWQAHYAQQTAPVAPANFVTVASLHRLIVASKHLPQYAGITVSKMVKAIGNDKGAGKLAHIICKPVYVNNVRYVNPWLASPAGLTALATGNFSKAPAK